MAAAAPLLSVSDLRISIAAGAGRWMLVDGVSLQVGAGEVLGLVGESGCGKSTVALSIVRYLGRAGRITGGRIRFEGRDLTTLDEAGLRAIRGRRIAMVYQDPMASLNPVMTVGRQLMEAPMTHEGVAAGTARARALAMLAEVKLADPEAVMDRVFEPFFRIDPARKQSIPGAGLGLAIAKEIIGRYDGEIILTNRAIRGLRQDIRFPRYVSRSAQVTAKPKLTSAA